MGADVAARKTREAAPNEDAPVVVEPMISRLVAVDVAGRCRDLESKGGHRTVRFAVLGPLAANATLMWEWTDPVAR